MKEEGKYVGKYAFDEAYDRFFGVETKEGIKRVEEMSSKLSDDIGETRWFLWFQVEQLCNKMHADTELTDAEKEIIFSRPVLEFVSSLHERIIDKGVERVSGSGLRTDLIGFHRVLMDEYTEIKEKKMLERERQKEEREMLEKKEEREMQKEEREFQQRREILYAICFLVIFVAFWFKY